LRIGLASDSHGNLDALARALDLFARAAVDRVFFLGGRFGDVDAVRARPRGAPAARTAPPELDFLAAFESALSRESSPAASALDGRVVRVASRSCPEYGAGAPVKLVDMAEGLLLCAVHDKAELSRDDIANATLFLHGNGADAALVRIGPRFFVTPGHLRAAAPGRSPATFALLDVGARELAFTVFAADGAELRREEAALGGSGKMSVRG
jgi:predicted phosphodiesterase